MTASPNRRKLPPTVWALGWVSLFTDMSSDMIFPLLPVFITTTLGASVAYLGLIEGIAESTASVLKIASGWWSDRVRHRKPLMIAGYGLAALTRPLIAMSGLAWHVLAARFIDRIGKGIRGSPRDALLAASVEPDERGAAFGVQRTMDNLGALIGPLIAWAMLHWVTKDFRVVFWVAVIPMAATMLMLIFRAREAPTVSLPKPRDMAPFVVPSRFKHYLASLLLFTLGNSSDAFLLLHARDVGVEPANLPLLWVALHIIKSTLSYPAGKFSDRVGRKALIIGGWCVYALVYLGFGYATSVWHIVVLFIIYGLFHSFTEPAEKALVADFFPDAQRGRAFGFYNAITGIGALPASLITGWIWSAHGPAAAFETGAMLALAAAVWLWAKV